MPSYQDLEVRTAILEDKLDFVMRTFLQPLEVGNVHPKRKVIVSLLELYAMAKSNGWMRGMSPYGKPPKPEDPPVEVMATTPGAHPDPTPSLVLTDAH